MRNKKKFNEFMNKTIEELKEKKVGIIFGNFSNLSQISKHEIDLSDARLFISTSSTEPH